ncbi:MAG: hypothetical protein KIS74_03110 [Burkholderiales bacterium]|nr:hypothetical protein [Burkholderiales bacterium]
MPPEHEHRRATDPIDGLDPFAAVSRLMSRYRVVVWGAVAFLVAMGFGFKTPSQQFKELETSHAERDAAIEARVDRLERIVPLVETNAVVACLSITEREALQYRLPCRRLLEGRDPVSTR